MKIIALVFLSLIALSFANDAHKHFIKFMGDHSKSYNTDEEFFQRFAVFRDNLKKIDKLNAQGGAVFGVTQFTDLTDEEFKNQYLMTNMPPRPNITYWIPPNTGAAPTTWDWRTKGVTTPVKNQGQCGSCWAFSATENIESVYKIGGNSLVTLSPQQIVDCDKDCYGCGGGWPYKAFNYVAKAGGQDTDASYPYTARDGSCKFKTNTIGAKIKGYKQIPKNEQQIQSALTTTAPFSICVDASQWSNYRSGVMRSNQCGRGIDHCVQLVGYDATANPPYWIVRNSWGTSWGQQGHIYLEMFKDTCAMAEDVTTATL
jgi:C1A family cysteine protease